MLTSLELKPAYHKGRDDIAGAFYVPCMREARRYDRAVGFFSSQIYVVAWEALPDFVRAGGRMRVICSPFLSESDAEALSTGYNERLMENFAERAREAFDAMMADPRRTKPAQILATLVQLGVLDLKVAFLGEGQSVAFDRLFHDKVGLFYDDQGAIVAFKGSMNETWNGLANDGNIESIDVYVSWEHERERERVLEETEYFSALWDNRYPTVSVRTLPDALTQHLIRFARSDDWEALAHHVVQEIDDRRRMAADRRPEGYTPRPHQADALQNWISAGRRGLLEHATGSGKTFTAICAMREEMERGCVPLVVVPSDLLVKQWIAEIEKHLAEIEPKILVCGGGYVSWRDTLGPWSREVTGTDYRVIIATVQTACRSDFRDRIRGGQHLFMVGDEVHRLGSATYRNVLQIESGPRLGLSATPTRYGDPEGTQRIIDYFGSVVPPPFTINDAIAAGTLTPYFYFVRTIALTDDEQADWNTQSQEISVFYARHQAQFAERPDLRARFNQMLIQRARLTKNAARKIPAASALVRDEFQPGAKWLVYCENTITLARVLADLRGVGLPAMEYHSEMLGDRERTITNFATNGGILVSIRCLDEGVDIPSVTHALIMASSRNPREFVQRRGRVLRRASGKNLAYIYDLVVVPAFGDTTVGDSIVEAELARAIEFGRSAANPSAITDIRRLAAKYSLDIEGLTSRGLEEDIDA